MNATAPAEQTLVAVPLEQISLGKNYRHRRPANWETKLDELGQSMKQNGQLEPVLLRPDTHMIASGHYEVVFGERRYRAAKKAELPTLLAIIRDVPDDQVLELQVQENNQRENPHPLDEAEGFAELVKRGKTVAEIAAALGRDGGYVAKRIALMQLGKEALEAFDQEKVTFGVALLLARIPDRKVQADALQGILSDSYDGPMPVEDARKLIEEQFMLRLEKAPFDITDATLVPKAGACTTCPKRTGNQRELFDDVKSADLCTDEPCFKAKSDAVWKIRKKEAEKGGTAVIEGREADFARHSHQSSKYRHLDAIEHLGNGKSTTIRKLLGKDLPTVSLARDGQGEVFEVVPRGDVNRALRAKKGEHETSLRGRETAYDQREAAEQRKMKLRRVAIREAIGAAVAKVGKVNDEKLFELVVRSFAQRAWNEVQVSVLERRGVKARGGIEAALVKLVKDGSADDVASLGLELALRSSAPWHGRSGPSGNTEVWSEGLKLVGVDFDAIERRVTAEAKTKKKGAKATGGHHHWAPNGRNACGKASTTGVGHGASSHFDKGVTCDGCVAFHETEKGQKVAEDQESETARIRAKLDKPKAKKAARKKGARK